MKNNTRLKKYSEGELIDLFKLKRVKKSSLSATYSLLQEWIELMNPVCRFQFSDDFSNIKEKIEKFKLFDDFEQRVMTRILEKAQQSLHAWNEEELKMNFISFIIGLINFDEQEEICTFYERTIEGVVEGVALKTKTDFMVATGILDLVKNPYFHFQEYKREKDPHGDPLGQLLEAFLVAQSINQNDMPLYGAYIMGRNWYFVVMEGKKYSVSPSFDSTKEEELKKIISIMRYFKWIMENFLIKTSKCNNV